MCQAMQGSMCERRDMRQTLCGSMCERPSAVMRASSVGGGSPMVATTRARPSDSDATEGPERARPKRVMGDARGTRRPETTRHMASHDRTRTRMALAAQGSGAHA